MTFEQNLEVTVILYFEISILYGCGETLERLKLIKQEFYFLFWGGIIEIPLQIASILLTSIVFITGHTS